MTAFGGALGGDPLGGSGLGVTKAIRQQSTYVHAFGPGATNWRCPLTGNYKFVFKGDGALNHFDGSTTYGGGSGAHAEITRFLAAGQLVVISSAATKTTTFDDGHVMSAGGAGVAPIAGVASGGDLNLNGSLGGSGNGAAGLGPGGGTGGLGNGSSGGGAGGPGTLDFPGGNGGDGTTTSGSWPSAGGSGNGSGNGSGASGMALVYRT